MSGCPCGGGDYAGCCGPLHDGAAAATPEALMRSRYSAYVLGLDDYVFRTWHPRTRPDDVTSTVAWTGLTIVEASGDEVEFVARYDGGEMRERSRFELRRGRWVYVSGVLEEMENGHVEMAASSMRPVEME